MRLPWGHVLSITCREILDELDDKPRQKRLMPPEESREVVDAIEAFSEVVIIEAALRAVRDDADDDKIVECAIAAKADYIVSGDRHLLALVTYNGIQIIRAAGLLRLLADSAEKP